MFNPVTFAASVSLSGANEVPAVTTTATGVALLRITADNKLYSKITVTNLEANGAVDPAVADPRFYKQNVLVKPGDTCVDAASYRIDRGILRGQQYGLQRVNGVFLKCPDTVEVNKGWGILEGISWFPVWPHPARSFRLLNGELLMKSSSVILQPKEKEGK